MTQTEEKITEIEPLLEVGLTFLIWLVQGAPMAYTVPGDPSVMALSAHKAAQTFIEDLKEAARNCA